MPLRRSPVLSLLLTALVLGSTTLVSCGETVTCWCRCSGGAALELSVKSSSPPSCEEICGEKDCWPDETYTAGCSGGETLDCTCENGGPGVQTCGSDGSWSECGSCGPPPECVEGRPRECDCGDGRTGTQTCVEGAWSDCAGCAGDCESGEARQCSCGEGLMGTQTCDAAGTWGACGGCAAPGVCEDGDEDICACEDGATGVQRCDGGQWGVCGGCTEEVIYADVDFGAPDGISVGGAWEDEFDTAAEWGCPAMAPGEDNVIWRIFPNDGTHPSTIWFDFDLPESTVAVTVDYYEMSISDGEALSQMEVLINGASFEEPFEPQDGCPTITYANHPFRAFIPGATNRIEVWSADNGHGLHHGLQGVWITYNY